MNEERNLYSWMGMLENRLPHSGIRQYRVFAVIDGNAYYAIWQREQEATYWCGLHLPDHNLTRAGFATIKEAEEWAKRKAEDSGSYEEAC